MTKHSRPKGRAAHMHPYRRNERQEPKNRRNTAEQDAGAQEQPGDARCNAPNADPPQGPASDADLELAVPLRPQPHLFGQLRILLSAAISLGPRLAVSNPRKAGPQTDICARVPGRFNTWVARLSCKDTFDDLCELVSSNSLLKSALVSVVRVDSKPTYTAHQVTIAGEVTLTLEPTDRTESNVILWTKDPGTESDDSYKGAADIEGYGDIPAILGEEGMKMVV
ncbi:hypothetical protein ACHAPI_012327 [Fusarium lateritium]